MNLSKTSHCKVGAQKLLLSNWLWFSEPLHISNWISFWIGSFVHNDKQLSEKQHNEHLSLLAAKVRRSSTCLQIAEAKSCAIVLFLSHFPLWLLPYAVTLSCGLQWKRRKPSGWNHTVLLQFLYFYLRIPINRRRARPFNSSQKHFLLGFFFSNCCLIPQIWIQARRGQCFDFDITSNLRQPSFISHRIS